MYQRQKKAKRGAENSVADTGERNLLDPPEVDNLYQGKYGVTRTALNQTFLADLPRSASILEVGCNLGNQLMILEQMGFKNVTGIEIHKEIVKEAKLVCLGATVLEGSALKIPFGDAKFGLVFTSGLLIHIAPRDLSVVMHEIYRCSKSWIWGLEYCAPETTEVLYRGQAGLLWKADFARIYTESFLDLELMLERRLSYLENEDSMFLLRRKNGSH
jgi:pseudaminic acid biosynthesis-associated methylase